MLTEIYLTNSNISHEKWLNLIHIISKYNGYFRKWKLIISCEKNKIRYFIQSNCLLPATINNMEAFLLKRVEKEEYIERNHFKKGFPIFHDLDDNFTDIYSIYESKKNRILKYTIIDIFPFSKNRFLSFSYLFFDYHGKMEKRNCFLIPSFFMSIDFEKNKRFFYQKVPKYLKIEKQLNLLNQNPSSAILHIDTFPYLQRNHYLNQNSYDFNRHSLILGSSGSGKSKFISLFVNNIYQNPEKRLKYKIVIIDPHASLEKDIGGLPDTKIIDFKEKKDTINLFTPTSMDYVSQTELFLSLFKNLIADQYNSKLERVLRYSIHLLLISEKFDFSNLRKLVLDVEFRSNLLKEYKMKLPLSVLEFFLNDFNELKISFYGEAISPIISFIDEMQLLPVFSESMDKEINTLKENVQNNFLTILSLDRMKLGDRITKTISGLVMQQLFGLAQSYTFPEHIIFILDEISVIENPIVCRFLSEARKYQVSIFIAGQYLNQVSIEVKEAILANVSNYYIFRVSKLDANLLVDTFDINIPVENTREYKIKLLTELPNRSCIVRVSNGMVLYSAMRATTLDFESIPRRKKEKMVENTSTFQEDSSIFKKKFKKSTNISLVDILKETSTSRKELKE